MANQARSTGLKSREIRREFAHFFFLALAAPKIGSMERIFPALKLTENIIQAPRFQKLSETNFRFFAFLPWEPPQNLFFKQTFLYIP